MLAIDCKMKAAAHGIENSPELKYTFVRHGHSSQRLDLPMSHEPKMGLDRRLADGSRHCISQPLSHKAATMPKSASITLPARDDSAYRQCYRRDYKYPYLSTGTVRPYTLYISMFSEPSKDVQSTVARHDQDHKLWRNLMFL